MSRHGEYEDWFNEAVVDFAKLGDGRLAPTLNNYQLWVQLYASKLLVTYRNYFRVFKKLHAIEKRVEIHNAKIDAKKV